MRKERRTYMIVKLLKIKRKEDNLKRKERKRHITYKGTLMEMTDDFQLKKKKVLIIKARRQQNNILNGLINKNCQHGTLYLVKYLSKNKHKIKSFSYT